MSTSASAARMMISFYLVEMFLSSKMTKAARMPSVNCLTSLLIRAIFTANSQRHIAKCFASQVDFIGKKKSISATNLSALVPSPLAGEGTLTLPSPARGRG
jgi:hypothetical protein